MKPGDTIRIDGKEYTLIEICPGQALIIEDEHGGQFLCSGYIFIEHGE